MFATKWAAGSVSGPNVTLVFEHQKPMRSLWPQDQRSTVRFLCAERACTFLATVSRKMLNLFEPQAHTNSRFITYG